MSTVDLSRWATDFAKRYAGVRMQQGRVLTDDDFNEAERIDAELDRRTRVDVIGPTGSPDQGFTIDGFALAPNGRPNFRIGAGTLYLGGLRLEAPTPEMFDAQRDWLGLSLADFAPAVAPGVTRTDLVWVEAWQQPVSAVEDSELSEVALGGADTSQRLRTMRRVRVFPGVASAGTGCGGAWAQATAAWAAEGVMRADHEFGTDTTLQVSFAPGSGAPDLCSPTVAGGYLGAENQAIRVQLIDTNSFTWGFDNAAPLYRALIQADPDSAPPGRRVLIELLTPPKDAAHWPRVGQVIELLAWSTALPNQEKLSEASGLLCRVATSYDPVTKRLRVTPEVGVEVPAGFESAWMNHPERPTFFDGDPAHMHVYLRVWDRGGDSMSPLRIPIGLGSTPLGTTGLRVAFAAGPRRAPDFWVIAARPETPRRVAPWILESAARPHGVKRYRTPLALVEWRNVGGVLSGRVLHDCRRPFLPLTKIRSCCSVTVGDGTTSFGHFTSIQAAVNALPPEGGEVCVLPGRYRESIEIRRRVAIRIHGCGRRSRIEAMADAAGLALPGFYIVDSAEIELHGLAIEAGPRSAVQVGNSRGVAVRECLLQSRDLATIWPTLFSEGDDVLIADNVVEVLPREPVVLAPPPPLDAGGPGAPGSAAPPPVLAFAARGGVQIAGGSDRVRIHSNLIRGGIWNGITLGSVRVLVDGRPGDNVPDKPDSLDPCAPCRPGDLTHDDGAGPINIRVESAGDLYFIDIRDNLISHAGLNGIGVVRFFNLASGQIVTVHGLHIAGNTITNNLRRTLAPPPAALQWQSAFGGIALAAASDLRIAGNEITHNGLSHLEPVCGVFAIAVRNLELVRNTIAHNGERTLEPVSAAKPGLRGGVWIWLVLPRMVERDDDRLRARRTNGVSTARVLDNTIVAPVGRSLTFFALGPVAVSRNRLVTQGSTGRDFDLLAAGVLIGNLGISNEWTLGLLVVFVLKAYLVKLASGGGVSPSALCGYAKLLGLFTPALNLTWPSGKTLFNDNQVTLDLADAPEFGFAASSILLLSLDDVGFADNQCEFDSRLVFLLAQVLLTAGSVRCADNRLSETWLRALRSALTLGGAMNATTGNQSTHCIDAMALLPNMRVFVDNRALIQAVCPGECDDADVWGQVGRIATGGG